MIRPLWAAQFQLTTASDTVAELVGGVKDAICVGVEEVSRVNYDRI